MTVNESNYKELTHYMYNCFANFFLMGDGNNIEINTSFYPTALKGCQGIVFTHGVRMGRPAAGKSLSRLYLRNHKV